MAASSWSPSRRPGGRRPEERPGWAAPRLAEPARGWAAFHAATAGARRRGARRAAGARSRRGPRARRRCRPTRRRGCEASRRADVRVVSSARRRRRALARGADPSPAGPSASSRSSCSTHERISRERATSARCAGVRHHRPRTPGSRHRRRSRPCHLGVELDDHVVPRRRAAGARRGRAALAGQRSGPGSGVSGHRRSGARAPA